MLDQMTSPAQPEEAHQSRVALKLAQRLSSYGQPERALAVLDLVQWLMPKHEEARHLQIKLYAQLGRWNEAMDLAQEEAKALDRGLMAEICWSLGLPELGDHFYTTPAGPLPSHLLPDRLHRDSVTGKNRL